VSRQFTVSKVLRYTPLPLLREFFAATTGGDLGLDWDALEPRQMQRVVDAVEALPRPALNAVEAALHRIHDLGCEEGIATLLETAIMNGVVGLQDEMPAQGNHYAAAMWAWLHRRSVFDKAAVWQFLDRLSWWRRRNDLPSLAPRLDPESVGKLGTEISEILKTHQGRGRHCTVDVLTRDETYYFCCYVDDYVTSAAVHDDAGLLVRRDHRPTFEVVFAYEREAGALELFARLPPRLKARLEKSFGDLILGHELGEFGPAYILDHVARRSFPLVTDPEDAVCASIRYLRLRAYGAKEDIALTTDPEDGPWAIYEMLDNYVNWNYLKPDNFEVLAARFRFEFEEVGDRRAGQMTFEVVTPRSCGLRSQPPEFIAVAQKYLARWGVQVQRDPLADNSVAA
jgi:hypothetical protein